MVTADTATHERAAARSHTLRVARCRSCGQLQDLGRRCTGCSSRGLEWEDVPATGQIWSFVVYHRAFSPELAGRVPYNVVLVALDCGLSCIGTLLGVPLGEIRIGTPVVGEVIDGDDARGSLVLFRPSGDAPDSTGDPDCDDADRGTPR